MDMKKRTSTIPLVMWAMVIYPCVAAVSVMSESNVTTSLCDGSIDGCLNAILLDSQLPTISSSHFRRILDQTDEPVITDALKTKPAVDCKRNGFYRKCGAITNPGGLDDRCAKKSYNRACSNLKPESQ